MAKKLVNTFGLKAITKNKSTNVNKVTNVDKAIKDLNRPKVKEEKPKVIKKNVKAIVVLDDNNFKAKLSPSPVEDIPDIIDFTEQSLSLKGKTYVYLKDKDKFGHYQLIIREKLSSIVNPGLNEEFDPFKPNMTIIGNIIKFKNKYYFDYTDIYSFKETQTDIENE